MTRTLVLVLLALSSAGCAAASEAPDAPDSEFCQEHRCVSPEEMTFAAAGEGIADMLSADLARWSAATGREITEAQDGIPVMWQESIPSALLDPVTGEHLEDCARTEVSGFLGHTLWTQEIRIDPTPPRGCPEPRVTLLHELEHALAPMAKHVAVDSLFAPSTGPVDRPIDDAALTRLCESFPCEAFAPEEGAHRDNFQVSSEQ